MVERSLVWLWLRRGRRRTGGGASSAATATSVRSLATDLDCVMSLPPPPPCARALWKERKEGRGCESGVSGPRRAGMIPGVEMEERDHSRWRWEGRGRWWRVAVWGTGGGARPCVLTCDLSALPLVSVSDWR